MSVRYGDGAVAQEKWSGAEQSRAGALGTLSPSCDKSPRKPGAPLMQRIQVGPPMWTKTHPKKAFYSRHPDGFCRFFGRPGSQAGEQSSTISNAIMAAAGFGIAGLAFLLVVRNPPPAQGCCQDRTPALTGLWRTRNWDLGSFPNCV
ncbi:anti-apoptotic protein NR13 [Patagioenas fasciata monilis]|uniref:Anti-apoptotic protein NR13 n=1 Tax=Patagioenas fasciata monilis TaxID=372326 RepID=A0A1V4JFN8_PATFA|nr:anti-apoptotic protein NR13 [Patagioenas fasciata monilis]